jgi:hypothetical protein
MKAGYIIWRVIPSLVISQGDSVISPGSGEWKSLMVSPPAHLSFSRMRADQVEWLIDWDPSSNVSLLVVAQWSTDDAAGQLDVVVVLGFLLAIL